MMIPTLLTAASTFALVRAQQVGTNTKEIHPTLTTQTCTSAGCKDEATKIVLDANWRWLHNVGGSTNCYTGNTWNAELCPDAASCSKNCALDGADYTGTYGITAASDSLAMKLVTKGAYSTNIGSRVYVMEDDEKYKMYKLLNQEFAFDVDVSKTPCGLNGALYFVQMDQDGGKARFPTNKAGAAYGTGYCDAQCPHDLKFVDGEANVEGWKPSKMDVNSGTGTFGSCCAEMDIWEANSVSNAYTPHPCTVTEQTRCTGTECGDDSSSERYKGVCDKDGCDWNPFRMGTKTFFGPGATFAVDSTKPFTVVTQFITDDKTANGNLVEIKRFYKQNGKVIANPNANIKGIDAVNSITDKMCSQQKTAFADPDDHAKKGGLKAMGKALQKGVVLAISMWTDSAAQCLWLDSNYPLTKSPSVPGVARGTCAATSGVPSEVVASSPDATVKFSNIRVGAIGSTTEGVSAAANSSTAPAASKADDADDAGEDSGSADAPATTPAATTKAPAASKGDDDAADADYDKSGSADSPATTPATTTKAPAPAASKADDDADDDETDESGSTDSPATDAPSTAAPATTPASTPAAPAVTTKAPSKKCKARRA